MAVTMDSPFKSAPRISKDKFVSILTEAGSFSVDALWGTGPEEARRDTAERIYEQIADQGHDPAVWLAIAGKEHTFGTNQSSVLWRNNTLSWTNARTVRMPGLRHTIITDSYRKSNYVKYASVYDSILDGLYRVDEPGFAYRAANAVSIIDHIRIWAPGSDNNKPEQYAATMAGWINKWIATDKENDPPMSAQIPGYVWHPASTTHYTRGRTVPVSGGAQHYTAGTNSLPWLTTSSKPPVSAHFLVKHNPTMDDRGWQLVRMEDTAWTTAFANPYTVSIEYEHTGKGDIPDIAYDVLIQTWKDISAYVKSKGLGEIEKIAGHKEWVNNPTLVCPDGIDIERIRKGVAGSPGQPPSVPPVKELPTVPDPWGSNYWIPRLFVDEIKRHDWMTVGHCKSGAFLEGRKIVQYFERARLELNEDGTVTRGLVGVEVYDQRYPNGAP